MLVEIKSISGARNQDRGNTVSGLFLSLLLCGEHAKDSQAAIIHVVENSSGTSRTEGEKMCTSREAFCESTKHAPKAVILVKHLPCSLRHTIPQRTPNVCCMLQISMAKIVDTFGNLHQEIAFKYRLPVETICGFQILLCTVFAYLGALHFDHTPTVHSQKGPIFQISCFSRLILGLLEGPRGAYCSWL